MTPPSGTAWGAWIELALVRLADAVRGTPPRAVLHDDLDAPTLPSLSRRRRAQLQQAGLFFFGVGLGVLVVVFTDLDRAILGNRRAARAQLSSAAVQLDPPNTRRVARHAPKEKPHGSSTRGIPTFDIGDLRD